MDPFESVLVITILVVVFKESLEVFAVVDPTEEVGVTVDL